MAAYVEHKFTRGFLLDEERLRRLRDIIAKRTEHANLPLTFKVYRGDSYSYETDSLDDVAREDNEDWRKITRLDVLINGKDELSFELTFSKDGAFLKIVGADRDKVFLLFSDIRDY